MKKTLPLASLLLLMVSTAYTQSSGHGFKPVSKKQGAIPSTFQAQTINGQNRLKSLAIAGSAYSNLNRNSRKLNKISFMPSALVLGKDSITPIFIERPVSNRMKSAAIQSPKEQAVAFLESVKSQMKIANPSESFFIRESKDDELGQRHIRMEQRYKGVKVYNSDFYLHFTPQKELFNGRYCIIDESINPTPAISKEKALGIAMADLKNQTSVKELTSSQNTILEYNGPDIDTVIIQNKQLLSNYSLAYQFSIRPNFREEWIYFVNAANGAIIKKYNNTHYDGPATASATDLNGVQRTINTYLEGGKYYLMDIAETMFNATKQEGIIITLNAQNTSPSNFKYSDITSTNNTWTNPAAVSAHYNAIQTYKYFKNTFNRNSINGQGGNIISFINVAEDDGSGMDNAYWNGKFISYGNGNVAFKPLAGGLDVAAHEIGHGVTENTANLEYQGQSGAINESYSDIFGTMVDRNDWYIGEDITKTTYIPTGRLRDMSNPHNGGSSLNDASWQPMHMQEIYTGTGDNSGVHVNSGIVNYAFYLFATAVTKEKAEQVYYRALTKYLTRFSQFIDLRLAVIQAAKDLYGDTSTEVEKAKSAFDAVGIYEEQSPSTSQSYPENPGQDYLLSYDTDPSNSNSLYRSSVTGTSFYPLSTTIMKGKASVVDNGAYAVFVSSDHKIRTISLDPNNPTESIVSNETIWANTAISKDGKRLAAITTYEDTAIYVYDYVSQKWGKFKLYNPTTQEGQKSGGVVYADAVEFDHSGEYLIYDAYNNIKSTTGDSLHYWDIGLIHVWNSAQNKFADGEIFKLFGSLPDSISIGNPVFSKNSPNVIAFDYLDEGANEYAIIGMNIETSDLGVIATNTTIGYPSFSKSDNKIAYTALNTSNNEVVAVVNLNTDKISSSATPSILIDQAQWPVYYATGLRTLGFAPVANFSVSYKSGKAPLSVKFTDLSLNNPSSWAWTFQSGTPSSSTEQNPSVTYNAPGTYAVTLKVTNAFGNNTITKSGYITVTNATGLTDLESSFRIYPNPVKDYLYIENSLSSWDNAEISIFTIDGKLIKAEHFTGKLDMSHLNTGIYILKLKNASDVYQVKIAKD